MLLQRCSKIQFVIVIIIFSMAVHFHIPVQASMYPLQTKYPDIMLYKGKTDKKVIALTFDDGPDQRFTPQVLEVLKKHNVKATFFLLGTRVHKYPEMVKRIDREGHIIGNHTYWHPDLTKTGKQNLAWEIEKNEKELKELTNNVTDLFRAPYGAMNEDLVEKLGEMGYRGIGWSIDSEDWKSLTPEKIKQNILNYVHPGAIILMHSAGHWSQDLSGTAEALDQIIPYLKKKGYEFVTVPELWS
ncbi:polysaccharide deacetylase family protein [Virgibacillus alimentarius]|uniref:Polysaccharide deacetylase family sporulation protein PdaB n=1 Tax=Virgibacillus alimentarius TaxID=698769 RepID=A0ABS4S8Z2_9BACI|nr:MULTISPECIES: polysaccharide deacetylase family protein [Virgibacillus]MBP2257536.1 polysaccharide deacetylase family sporulation protein PdaB [Virgibacillus alimentarius]HLR68888.1 polysaccharide deacetylase family protein [Virgibacillus sp.]